MTATIAPRTIIEAFLPAAGAVELSTIYAAANALGIADQPLRLALRRMIIKGLISQHGRGRSGTIMLTAEGRGRIEQDRLGLQLARLQDTGAVRWDGQWRLIAISVPEQQRSTRDAIRRGLLAAGAANLATALFVSPHDLTQMLGESALPQLVTATATDLTVRGQTKAADIAEELWPTAPINAGYDMLEQALDDDDTAETFSMRKIRLADALERAIRNDPLLPPELRPEPWRPMRLRIAWTKLWNSMPTDGERQPYAGWLP
ncbi:PaaX family transcriptional regulator [Arthrobacter sp. MYb227]|uniref:PaaX family transcriptional regulator n=1 Tax=Arthrobacter sp. MYb227 TaxID=1848601 RepID=UPI0015E38C61|nr:PaaX family transcriptional regulator [Arthrobacter sp. MYb227]